jgi:HEAT repeat protein
LSFVLFDLMYLLPVAAIGAMSWANGLERRWANAAWSQLAARLKHPLVQGSNPVIVGERRGRSFRVAGDALRGGKIVCEVQLDRTTTPTLSVRRRDFGQVKVDGATPTGDAAFDAAVTVQGAAAWVAAVFDQGTRDLVLRLIRLHGNVDMGQVNAELDEVDDTQVVVGLLETMLDVALALHVPHGEARARLSLRAKQAPSEPERQEALRLLCEGYPDSAEARRALTAALADPDAHLKLAGARLAGDAGVASLTELVLSPQADPAVRVEALAALAAQVPYPQRVPALRAALVSDADALRAAALAQVIAERDPSQLEEVWMALERGGPLTVPAAAQAMGLGPHPRSEDELGKLLAHDDLDVRLAAVASLGQMGSAAGLAALEALHSLDPRLLLAAREAKQHLRGRLGA